MTCISREQRDFREEEKLGHLPPSSPRGLGRETGTIEEVIRNRILRVCQVLVRTKDGCDVQRRSSVIGDLN